MSKRLATILEVIALNDTNYPIRAINVYAALAEAARIGYPAGIRTDPQEPDWPVIFIELPGAGQVSWHMPQHAQPYDGHSTPEKYDRIARYIKQAAQ